jgi:uncharacterized protein (TIGR02246 family)
MTLQELVDIRAIEQLVADYGLMYDSGDFVPFAGLFTADATYDITPDPELFPLPVLGRDAIVESMSGRWSRNWAYPRHFSSNVSITDLTESTAHVRSLLMVVFVQGDQQSELRRSGTYVDRVRREEDGRWRFSSRHLHLLAVPRLDEVVGHSSDRTES